MNRQVNICRRWHWSFSLFIALLVVTLCFGACTREKTDASDLISTVPSSAGGVVGINVTSILEKAGYKVENGVITPPKKVNLDLSSLSERDRSLMELFFSGETGIDPAGAILFYDSNRTYVTFGLSDTGKFRDFVEKRNGKSFSESNGVAICGDVAMKGAQAWVTFSDRPIDYDVIIGYSSLVPSQSFLNNPYGEQFRAMDHDFIGWSKMKIITKNFLDFQQTTMFNLFSSSLFEDADEVIFDADFLKGKFECELKVLNGKGKPAKYLLPADKVNVATIKTIGENADVVFAATVSPKLFNKLEKLGSTISGDSYKNFTEMVKNIDGTIAVGCSNLEGAFDENLSGVITTDGKPSLVLKGAVSTIAPMRMDGDLIRFSRGKMDGALKVDRCADMLKGASLGIVSDFPAYPISELSNLPVIGNSFATDIFELYCLRIVPDDGSIELEMIIEAKDKSENIIKTVLSQSSGK